jgi:flagellar protein FliS
MTQGELLVLLLDELVKRCVRADYALSQKNYPLFEESAERCVAILRYLDETLDRNYAIGRELHRMYDFLCYDFIRVKIGRNQEELTRLRPMVTDLRDAFRAAEKKAGER